MTILERADLQGLLVRGYGEQPAASFVLLHVEDAAPAKRWLASRLPQITAGDRKPIDTSLNVALTYAGFEALGVAPETLAGFSPEFREGMTTEHRRRILGDHGASDPAAWRWGGPRNETVHVMLLLYAADEAALERFVDEQAASFPGGGIRRIGPPLTSHLLTSPQGWSKEHFGFHDGIAQPVIPELKKKGDRSNWVPAGEFILGYPNAYGQYTERPLVDPARDPGNVLANDLQGSGQRDLGVNGTYLVFRQLEQDVPGFWAFMSEASKNGAASEDASAPIRLAAKMMGRWPSGAPLVKSPDADDAGLSGDDDFGFHHTDPHGFACPIGAHIRRANTRDALDPGPGTERSLAISNRHRILRRGRPYGTPVALSLEPAEMLEKEADGERGLYFICCSGNISRQFEFIHHTWINNPKFGGLYEDVDPIIGDRNPYGQGLTTTFTEPAAPVRKRVKNVPAFVTVRGGSYFFMPGLRALRYLSSMP